MQYADYVKYDALGLAELVRDKDVSASELVETAIGRAEAINPSLNFMVFADFRRARDDARCSAATGRFAGVPMFLKDILAFAKGMPTRQGARFIPAVAAKEDSVLTTRFRNAGFPLAKPMCPSSAWSRRRNRSFTARRGILSISPARRAAHRAGPRLR
jgi:amidase